MERYHNEITSGKSNLLKIDAYDDRESLGSEYVETTKQVKKHAIATTSTSDLSQLTSKEVLHCSMCPYIAKKRVHLSRHEQHHDKGMQLQCSFCTYSVSTTGRMNQHVAKCHSNETAADVLDTETKLNKVR